MASSPSADIHDRDLCRRRTRREIAVRLLVILQSVTIPRPRSGCSPSWPKPRSKRAQPARQETPIGAGVGSVVGRNEGTGVVGRAVGSGDGIDVGKVVVGKSVGNDVGIDVGGKVGSAVGTVVGRGLGAGVGGKLTVGDGVGCP